MSNNITQRGTAYIVQPDITHITVPYAKSDVTHVTQSDITHITTPHATHIAQPDITHVTHVVYTTKPDIAYVDILAVLVNNQLQELSAYETAAKKLKTYGMLGRRPKDNHRLIMNEINDSQDIWRNA